MIFVVNRKDFKRLVGVFDSLENAVRGMERSLPTDEHRKRKNRLVGVCTQDDGRTVVVTYEVSIYKDTVSFEIKLRQMNKLVRETTFKKVNWAFVLNMEGDGK